MAESEDSRRDHDGYVYEKDRFGQYEKKWDFWRQDYERDKASRERRSSDYAADGTPLYRTFDDTPEPARTSSGSSGEAGLVVFLILAGLALGTAGFLITATPVIAPALILTTENARKRGDLATVQKWQNWASGASALAAAMSLGFAIVVAIGIGSQIQLLSQQPGFLIPDWLIYPILAAVSITFFVLSSITFFAPTAILLLRSREEKLRAAGLAARASRTRLARWIISIIGIVTVLLVVLATAVYIFVAAFAALLSR